MESNFYMPQSVSLKQIMHSIWQTERKLESDIETIIPKGVVEIIFNFSEHNTIHAQIENKLYTLPRCFINGYNTKPLRIQFTSHQSFFGVRFQPTVIGNIFGVPAGEFANNTIDLTLINAEVNSLWHLLIECKNFKDRVSVVSAWLLKRFNQLTNQEIMVNQFLTDFEMEVQSVKELSGLLCYSSRHLSRKLSALTGMNTEEVLLYKRYLQSINLIHHSNMSLTEIAYSCQFADQSHFIKTFKSLALITPGDYKKRMSPLPGHIYQNVR